MAPDADPSDWIPKRIGIIGAGAMGTSLAALLGSVIPVVLVCRNPDRAAAIFRHGLRADGRLTAASRPLLVRSIADLPALGGLSAIFIATKTTAIPQLAAELRPLLPVLGDQPRGPYLISYQNGIEPGRQLMTTLEHPRVLRMVLNLAATLDPATGHAHISLCAPPQAIGSPDPAHHPAARRLAALLTDAGLETTFDPDIERRVWFKGVVNAAMNPIAALTNATIREVLQSPAADIVDRLLREGLAVAAAHGVGLGPGARERMHAIIAEAGDHTPSMVEDIRAGRESEVGQLNRQIIEHGRATGVATPTHDVIDALIETFDWKVYARPAAPSPGADGRPPALGAPAPAHLPAAPAA